MTTVAVIGAGVTGLTTAYELLDRGFEVTVFDRHRYAAMETSFANGGQLSASNAETWTQWGTVLKGLKWMLQADAPLLVNPRPTLHKIGWMAEFLSNIPRYKANTVETVRLAIAARSVLFEMAAREGIDFDLERRGILHFYDRQKDLAHARMVNGLLARGRAGAARAGAGRDQGDRAGAARRLRRRLPDRERQLRRHPQVHHGAGAGLRAARRDAALRDRRRRRGGGRRRGADHRGRARGGVRRRGGRGRRPQPGDRAGARRPGERLSGEGLLDHRRPERRREPGGGAVDQPARRPGEDRREPLRQGPLPGGRDGRVQRRQQGHPGGPDPAAGRMVREALPGHVDRACDALGRASGR